MSGESIILSNKYKAFSLFKQNVFSARKGHPKEDKEFIFFVVDLNHYTVLLGEKQKCVGGGRLTQLIKLPFIDIMK